MLRLIIGNKVYSSWSLRGWLALKQSGLPFEEDMINLYGEDWPERRAAPDLAVSGGKVPTLWDGEDAMWDSLAIIEHLDDLTGGTRFWPEDKASRMLARSMAAEMHSSYMALRREHPMNLRRVYPAREPGPEVAADVTRIVALWEQALGRHDGDFLFGAFGAVDIMFAPVVTRFVTYALPVSARAKAYMDAVVAHPFMAQWREEAMAESWTAPQYEFDIAAG